MRLAGWFLNAFSFIHILQAEEARTRGTPVTPEAFLAWKSKFDKELAARRFIEQEEHAKGLPGKERDELRKVATRLTGSLVLILQ